MALLLKAFGLLAIALLLAGPLGRDFSPEVTAAAVREASERKELPPELLADIGYWERHERNKARCRGQTYVAQCCDNRFDYGAPTCLNPEDIR